MWNDQIFRTEKEKNDSILKKIAECYKIGQPILVFTSSINKSEQYSNILSKAKIPHTVLNAKNHEKEAEIIANAGKLHSIIITTSISGRGVDIQLGGKKGVIRESELKIAQKELTDMNTRLTSAESTWQMAENLYRQLADQVREHDYDIKDLNR